MSGWKSQPGAERRSLAVWYNPRAGGLGGIAERFGDQANALKLKASRSHGNECAEVVVAAVAQAARELALISSGDDYSLPLHETIDDFDSHGTAVSSMVGDRCGSSGTTVSFVQDTPIPETNVGFQLMLKLGVDSRRKMWRRGVSVRTS